MEYSREQAIADLKRYGLTQDEAERFLSGSETERIKIWHAVQERAIAEKEALSWQPMPPQEGPPLPRRLAIRWPVGKEEVRCQTVMFS